MKPTAVNLKTFSIQGPILLAPARRPPDTALLQMMCRELLADVPRADQLRILGRLNYMRRADDLDNLRAAMFDVIAQSHGLQVARERIETLDRELA